MSDLPGRNFDETAVRPRLRGGRATCAFLVPILAMAVGACSDPHPAPEAPESVEIRERHVSFVDSLHAQGHDYHRVTGGVFLADGGIVIGNGGAATVFLFDADARFAGAFGSSGVGPGEFRRLTWLGAYRGDSIATFDAGLRRLQIFSREGRYGRSLPLPELDVSGWGALAASADGGFVLYGITPATPRELHRDSITIYRLGPDGDDLQVVSQMLGDEVFYSTSESGGRITVLGFPRPYGLRLRMAVDTDRLVYGDGAVESVRIVALDPVASQSERPVPLRSKPLPSDARHTYINQQLEGQSGPARHLLRESLSQIPFPDQLPSLSGLLLDGQGRLWVATYRPDGSPRNEWVVLELEDLEAPVESLRLPDDAELMAVHGDLLLVLRKDELGLERIERWTTTPEPDR